mgnify:CR=1 FL=1
MAAPIDLHAVAERELEDRSRYPWRIKACTSTACQLAGDIEQLSHRVGILGGGHVLEVVPELDDDVSVDIRKDDLRASGRDALASLEYTWAAMQSYEQGGILVRPHPLPLLKGDPTAQ